MSIRNLVLIPILLLVIATGAYAQDSAAWMNNPYASAGTAAPNTPELTPSANGEGITLAHAKESFTTLSLKDSELNPEAPMAGGTEEQPEFIRELIQVQWRPRDPIYLYVIRPRGVKKPPVVLYLYSYPTETDRFTDDAYCRRLVRGGSAAVGFVSAFTGQRADHHAPAQWFVSQLQEALATSVHDVQMVLNYLDTRGDLDMTRVGMFGQGSGGTIAILAAAADPRIKALDLLDPWGDWPDWLAKAVLVPETQRANFLQPEFLAKVAPLEPLHYLPELKSRRLRMQFVDNDGNTPKEVVAKMEATAPGSAKLVDYPDRPTMLSVSSGGQLFAWIAEQLKN
jgi:hypothetical protein